MAVSRSLNRSMNVVLFCIKYMLKLDNGELPPLCSALTEVKVM